MSAATATEHRLGAPGRWPDAAVALADPSEAASVYDEYPALFAPAYPGIDPARARSLTTSARYFASALFVVDDLLDGDRPAPAAPLRLTALLHESYVGLAHLFEADDPFWDALQECLSRHLGGMAAELPFRVGNRDLATLGDAEAMAIAADKCALSEVTAHALGALSTRPSATSAVVTAIREYNLACTLLDDLRDWRSDVTTGAPTLLLARARRRLGATGADPSAIEQLVYFDGLGRQNLTEAADHLRAARAAAGSLPVPRWLAVVCSLESRIARHGEEIGALVRHRPAAASGRVSVWLPRPDPADPWAVMAHAGGTWLLRESTTSWRGAHHVMRFGQEAGFATDDSGLVVGDVFTRALIGTVLADWNQHLGDDRLHPVLDAIRDHLLRRARPRERGRWSYFPALAELPADADDVAEVVRFLGVVGLDPETRALVLDTLDFAVSHRFGDGSVPTWLVDDASPLAARQKDFVARAWGAGVDCEVVANLADATAGIDPHRYAPFVRGASDYLAEAQDGDGGWPATWYHGTTWAWWVGARALRRAADAPGGERFDAALSRLGRAVAARQRNGGWGATADGSVTPGHTALALLALGELGPQAPEVDRDAARDVLAGSQEAAGCWPAEPLISMDVSRAAGGPSLVITHGSPHLTTALVCRAALSARSR